MYTYTAELFPTNVRTVGLGLGSLGGGLGGIIAPYILTLQVKNRDGQNLGQEEDTSGFQIVEQSLLRRS